ncbi:MAG: Gfo/Idh/MocA family oxidoreductase [Saprospiraceae bacterium]|nr:Gfo/Idh/MocA family oxidoreductase [Saprospiraceae bacterium]
MNRRQFIKTSTLLSSSIAMPTILLPSQKKSIGVALVGLGYYSTGLLAPAFGLTQYCHLAGIVTGTPNKAVSWQKQYGIKDNNIYNYENMHEMADNPDIDVVYIVTPNALHLKYAAIAANAGKHVWCEKPLEINGAQGQKLLNVCAKNKVQLTVGYRMQHEANTRTIMSWSKSKPYGKIKLLNAEAGWNASGYEGWKLEKELGGGAMYDMGTYPLNAARYVTGEEPIAVIASHYTDKPNRFSQVDETTTFKLEFPSGAIADCTTTLAKSVNKLHVNCQNGYYGLEPFQSYNGVRGSASDGVLLNTYVENQQAKQMDDDALAILNNTSVMVPGEDGLKDMFIMDAIFESASKGGKRIQL